MTTLFQILPDPQDLLSLPPEVLAGTIIECIPDYRRNEGRFQLADLIHGCFRSHGNENAYSQAYERPITLAIAEALNWLTAQGLVMLDPTQPVQAQWLTLTRRGQSLKTGADVEASLSLVDREFFLGPRLDVKNAALMDISREGISS
ncbi:hypothetical protein [Rhodomicrobium lacus]|uniref:hypothetical protein n=1 Tax=Rhodomicrobium lacus TaxID=2498452 RepID=UPI000F8F6155|nr:hypothetical protein [Rhodomicrobium lacus]